MSGVYARNKLFSTLYRMGTENLPTLVRDVNIDGAVTTSVFENYETAVEEDWPDFIKDFCGNDA